MNNIAWTIGSRLIDLSIFVGYTWKRELFCGEGSAFEIENDPVS